MKYFNTRLEKITNELIASILMIAKKIDRQAAYEKINQAVSNGKAAEKLNDLIKFSWENHYIN